jgi:hypothetical protein
MAHVPAVAGKRAARERSGAGCFLAQDPAGRGRGRSFRTGTKRNRQRGINNGGRDQGDQPGHGRRKKLLFVVSQVQGLGVFGLLFLGDRLAEGARIFSAEGHGHGFVQGHDLRILVNHGRPGHALQNGPLASARKNKRHQNEKVGKSPHELYVPGNFPQDKAATGRIQLRRNQAGVFSPPNRNTLCLSLRLPRNRDYFLAESSTCTGAPSASESDGSTITSSCGPRPESTSTVFP